MPKLKALFLAFVAAVICAGGAHAQEITTPVGCRGAYPAPDKIFDVSGAAARNSVGPTELEIFQVGAVYSDCDGDRDGRWRFEASVVAADSDFQDAQGALVGVGYQFAVGPRSSITPVIRIGYESFDITDDQVVTDVAVTAATSIPLADSSTLLTLEWVPEYTNRQTAGSLNQGLAFDDSTFTSYVAAGIDMPFGAGFRSRISGAHRYIGDDGLVSSIGSVAVSIRQLSDDAGCGGYCWNLELSYSRGDGDYEGLLVGISRRFGH